MGKNVDFGRGMVGNLIFIHFGTKETIPDHSPTQNRHFTQKIHILAYFEGIKIIGGSMEVENAKKSENFSKIEI